MTGAEGPTLVWLCAVAALDDQRWETLDLPVLAAAIARAEVAPIDPHDQAAALLVALAPSGRRLAALAAITWLGEGDVCLDTGRAADRRLRKLVGAAAENHTTVPEVALALRDLTSRPKAMGDAMFERFTDRARRALTLAQVEAGGLGHDFIGTEHVLLGLLVEGEGVAAVVLGSLGVTTDDVRKRVVSIIGRGVSDSPSPPFTPRAQKVLELSMKEALKLGHNYIGTEHMLLGIVREGEGVASVVLGQIVGDAKRITSEVIQTLSGYGRSAKPDPLVDAYRVDVAAMAPLSAEEEAELRGQAVDAPAAAQRLVEGHLGRVLQHVLQRPASAVSAVDLIQAGNTGLVRAVPVWAAGEGERFWDVAGPLVKEAVDEASARSEPTAMRCSFCGKSKNQVAKLIAGPGVFICDECIRLCQDIITEELAEAASETADEEPNAVAAACRCGADMATAAEVVTATIGDAEVRLLVCSRCRAAIGTA